MISREQTTFVIDMLLKKNTLCIPYSWLMFRTRCELENTMTGNTRGVTVSRCLFFHYRLIMIMSIVLIQVINVVHMLLLVKVKHLVRTQQFSDNIALILREWKLYWLYNKAMLQILTSASLIADVLCEIKYDI